MDDGTTKDVKYLNRDEGRALVKELCEHKTEFCLMGAVEMTKDYILPVRYKILYKTIRAKGLTLRTTLCLT